MSEETGSVRIWTAYVSYILALLIFGTNGFLAAHISVDASQIVLMRTLLGGTLLTFLVFLRGGFDKERVRSELIWIILGGAALGCNWVALFEAYRLVNVSLATLIYYAGPMIVILLSPVLFHEKLNGQKMIALCLVAVGLVCISGSIAFGGAHAQGLITAAVSALFYASLIVFNKRIVRTDGMQTAAAELVIAFVVVLIYVMTTSGLPHFQTSDIPYVAVIGIVNTGLAYLLYFSGLQRLPGQSVALLSYIDPVSTLIFAALLLNEAMTPVQMIGAVLLLGGAMYGEARRKKDVL